MTGGKCAIVAKYLGEHNTAYVKCRLTMAKHIFMVLTPGALVQMMNFCTRGKHLKIIGMCAEIQYKNGIIHHFATIQYAI